MESPAKTYLQSIQLAFYMWHATQVTCGGLALNVQKTVHPFHLVKQIANKQVASTFRTYNQ